MIGWFGILTAFLAIVVVIERAEIRAERRRRLADITEALRRRK